MCAVFSRETYAKSILRAREAKKGRVLKKPPPSEALGMLFTVTLARPMKMLVVEPIVIFVSL